MEKHIDIVFDGPPSHESGRFVEVENELGQSIKFGEWVERDDGYWALRFTPDTSSARLIDALKWVSDDTTDRARSFNFVCQRLGLSPTATRRELMKALEAAAALCSLWSTVGRKSHQS